MIPDENVAYAIAAWSRFDSEVSDDVQRALAGAFALVAAADGQLSAAEVDRFAGVLQTQKDVFSAIEIDALEDSFRELADAIISDPVGGRGRALAAVKRVREAPTHAQLVYAGAQIALAADHRAHEVEEAALTDVRAALGLA